jgi:hypothetical protein
MNIPSAKPFSITAHTFIIKGSGDPDYRSLLEDNIQYHIPIFQRSYAWTEKETGKLLADLFMSYWGIDGEGEPEPMFIGTMQLSELKPGKDTPGFYDVIDGQQRLTTLLILLKYFSLASPGCLLPQGLRLDWLRTSVSNGIQQEELDAMLDINKLEDINPDSINPFVKNLFTVSQLARELADGTGKEEPVHFSTADFLQHICTRLYFVVIQTRASLTKTLQIFNAINTTGLDLNGGDIFKLRMFEYLKDRNTGAEENDLFKEISKLYERIEVYNREYGDNILAFNEVLNVYRHILIQRYDLPLVLHDMGVDLFYSNLFDAISRAARPEHFRNLNDMALSCRDMHRIIDVMIDWDQAAYPTVEDACCVSFTGWSRYGKFSVFIYLFLYKYKGTPDCWTMVFPFLRNMSRVYWSFSIIFQRRVYHLDSWSYECMDFLMDSTYAELMEFIKLKIAGTDQYNRNLKEEVTRVLSGPITANYKTKTLICRLSALLDENYRSDSHDLEISVTKRLFGDVFDVEHIQSYRDKDLLERDKILDAWGDEINAIGNLVAMESSINRSMHNDAYADKRPAYRKSGFPSIAKLLNDYPVWGLDLAKARKDLEIKKMTNYVFESAD